MTSYTTKAGTKWRYQLWVPKNADVPDGHTKLLGKGGYADENAAMRALLEAIEARDAGTPTPEGQAPTVKAYANQWVDGLNGDDLAGSTIDGYRRHVVKHIAPALGHIRLDKLTPTRIAVFYRELRAAGNKRRDNEGGPLSSNTVNKIRVTLTAILTAAVEDGWLKSNPAQAKAARKAAPRPARVRAERPEIVTWDASTLRAFLNWSRDRDDELFTLWHTIAATGMRRSEALALKWQDIDFRNGRISVRRAVDTSKRDKTKSTKTDKPRVVSITEADVAVLKALKALRGSVALDLARRDAYVFGLPDGRLRRPDSVSAMWTRRVIWFTEGRDIPKISLHDLRHTHATILLGVGEHPKVVQERLGHTTIATTMDLYSHVTETMQRSAAERFAMLLNG